MGLIGGTLQLSVDGNLIDAGEGEFEIDPGTPVREPVMGQQGLIGHTEKVGKASIKGMVHWFGQFDLAAVLRLANAVVSVRLRTGRTATIYGATQVSSGVVKTDKGEVELEFQGRELVWS